MRENPIENPIKMDDDWGYPYDSGNPHMCVNIVNIVKACE